MPNRCRPCGASLSHDAGNRGLAPPGLALPPLRGWATWAGHRLPKYNPLSATDGRGFMGIAAAASRPHASAAFALSTIASNAAGSAMAISESDLAVELDVRPQQAVDELAVSHAALADGRVDADDPQLAELAFADAAVAEGKRLGPDDRLLDAAVEPAAAAGVAFRLLEQAILLAPTCGADASYASEELPMRCFARPGLRSAGERTEVTCARRACSDCVYALPPVNDRAG